ncbi:MAG: hypothetical protein RL637_46 [Pseudomonadota bacterium]|jgi:polyprenyl P-hydroxybenzoate/phenylacrylic acid decarboxylase-like protein
MSHQKLIIAITGATGAIYGLRCLQILQTLANWETHLIISKAGLINIKHELNLTKSDLYQFANYHYAIDDITAAIASGGFKTSGMLIAPCSMKTVAAIAHGFGDNLISRSADVILKERRRLVIMPRETPLHLIHLRNLTAITEMGGIIYPPLPAFYQHPSSIAAMVDETVGRVLELFGIETEGLYQPWTGLS